VIFIVGIWFTISSLRFGWCLMKKGKYRAAKASQQLSSSERFSHVVWFTSLCFIHSLVQMRSMKKQKHMIARRVSTALIFREIFTSGWVHLSMHYLVSGADADAWGRETSGSQRISTALIFLMIAHPVIRTLSWELPVLCAIILTAALKKNKIWELKQCSNELRRGKMSLI